MAAGEGSPEAVLSEEHAAAIIAAGVPAELFGNRRVLVLTTDATRTCPLPMMVRAIRRAIGYHTSASIFWRTWT